VRLNAQRSKVISVSGDGGFPFSAVELETAVLLKCNFVHLVCIDGSYTWWASSRSRPYGRDAAVHLARSTW
jgi:acetolactate synthase I/II/III large subunit